MATIYELREAIASLRAAEHRVDGLIDQVLPPGTKVTIGRKSGLTGKIKTYSLPYGNVVVAPDDVKATEEQGYRFNDRIGGISVEIDFVYPVNKSKKQ